MGGKRKDPNGENCSLKELEVASACTPRRQSAMRMKAIHALLIGVERKQVQALFNVSLRTLNKWIKRFNASGIDGLIEKPRSGRPRAIKETQKKEYHRLITHPEVAKQTHWTATKFHGYLREELGHQLGYSTLVRWMHEQGFVLKVPRPWSDKQDEHARQAFIEKIKQWVGDSGIELWFGDESGIEGDPRPRRRWVQKGEKARVGRTGMHIRMNVTGMVCPRTGQFYALEFSHSDTDSFQAFLDEANRDIIFERKKNFLIVDNASWHKAKRLKWGKLTPIYLPPYSPDLNPIEKLWMVMKAEWFTDFVAKNHDELIHRLDLALNWLAQRKLKNQSTCSIANKL